MAQQIIVIIIGVAVAAYVVYHIVRAIKGKSSSCHCGCQGCKSASCRGDGSMGEGRREEIAKKNATSACRIKK